MPFTVRNAFHETLAHILAEFGMFLRLGFEAKSADAICSRPQADILHSLQVCFGAIPQLVILKANLDCKKKQAVLEHFTLSIKFDPRIRYKAEKLGYRPIMAADMTLADFLASHIDEYLHFSRLALLNDLSRDDYALTHRSRLITSAIHYIAALERLERPFRRKSSLQVDVFSWVLRCQ